MFAIRLAVTLGLLAAAAAEGHELTVPARVVRVIDGDTVEVLARPWPGQTIQAIVRLAGVDAPELRGEVRGGEGAGPRGGGLRRGAAHRGRSCLADRPPARHLARRPDPRADGDGRRPRPRGDADRGRPGPPLRGRQAAGVVRGERALSAGMP